MDFLPPLNKKTRRNIEKRLKIQFLHFTTATRASAAALGERAADLCGAEAPLVGFQVGRTGGRTDGEGADDRSFTIDSPKYLSTSSRKRGEIHIRKARGCVAAAYISFAGYPKSRFMPKSRKKKHAPRVAPRRPALRA